MILFFQNIIFNTLFYGACLFFSVIYIPALLLPKKLYIHLLHFYFWSLYQIEKHILGLDYEVRGTENIPKGGAFLVAAKHQSAYETLKLHLIFGDPAIILKRELYHIPIWGWQAAKSDMIAIDRSKHREALKMIISGAQEKLKAGRPVVIFPQGTRVKVEETLEQKPYKSGITRIYEASNVPVLPMALNTGLFWPKNSFYKKPGKVIFSIMPAIPPGLPIDDVEKKLKDQIETETNKLIEETKSVKTNPAFFGVLLTLLILFAAAYSALWFGGKFLITRTLKNVTSLSEITVDGFPKAYSASATLTTPTFNAPQLLLKSWLLPGTVSSIEASEGFHYSFTNKMGEQTVDASKLITHFITSSWPTDISNEGLFAWAKNKPTLYIKEADLAFPDSRITATGIFTFDEDGIPQGSATLNFYNHENIIERLSTLGLLKRTQRNIIISLLQMQAGAQQNKEGITITLPLKIEGKNLMLGPFTVARMPEGAIFWGVQKLFPDNFQMPEIEMPVPDLPPEVLKNLPKNSPLLQQQ